MKCDNIDFITRNGHSDIFKYDVKKVLDCIDLGINNIPKLVFYTVIAVPRFEDDNSWYRIPCKDRTVYARKCGNLWDNEYEIAYRSKLSVYGYNDRNGYYRILRLEYDEDTVSIDYYSPHEQMNRIHGELVSPILF